MSPSSPESKWEAEPEQWRKWMLAHNHARSHLSSERTFLAWVRTSVAFITLGFVVQRFDLLLDSRHARRVMESGLFQWVPMSLFLMGGALILIGAVEYFINRRRINAGERMGSSRWGGALVGVTLAFLLLVIVAFLIAKP